VRERERVCVCVRVWEQKKKKKMESEVHGWVVRICGERWNTREFQRTHERLKPVTKHTQIQTDRHTQRTSSGVQRPLEDLRILFRPEGRN
jgi:hypothetical protein